MFGAVALGISLTVRFDNRPSLTDIPTVGSVCEGKTVMGNCEPGADTGRARGGKPPPRTARTKVLLYGPTSATMLI